MPQSEVSYAGTPYLEIQPAMRVSAQVEAAMSRMGSSQQPDGGDSCADPCREIKQGFLAVSRGLPFFKSFSRICLNI